MNDDNPTDDVSPRIIYIVRRVIFFISKLLWNIKFIGLNNIPPEDKSGLLIVSNHQTYLDPFWISLPVKRDLRYMAWDKAFDWFFIGYLIRKLGAFPVNTNFGSRASYKKAFKTLNECKTLMVFPEAAREFADGKLLKFKTGAAKLAIQTGVPILPVTVRGANLVWPREFKFPRLSKVEIIYHPVIDIRNSDLNLSPERLTESLREIIDSGNSIQKTI